jgi:hypothetical protein
MKYLILAAAIAAGLGLAQDLSSLPQCGVSNMHQDRIGIDRKYVSSADLERSNYVSPTCWPRQRIWDVRMTTSPVYVSTKTLPTVSATAHLNPARPTKTDNPFLVWALNSALVSSSRFVTALTVC